MSNNTATKIQTMITIANEMKADGYACEFVDDYSGRGMFGKTCCGFVVDDIFEVKYRMREKGIKVKAVEDDMGLSHIVYYPSIAFNQRG